MLTLHHTLHSQDSPCTGLSRMPIVSKLPYHLNGDGNVKELTCTFTQNSAQDSPEHDTIPISNIPSGETEIYTFLHAGTTLRHRMPRPAQMASGPHFRETLRNHRTVFAMFYRCSDTASRAMLPIFESLCAEHSSPSVAFVKVKKDDWPGLCVEHCIPRSTSLTFTTFKNEDKIDSTDGADERELERMVERHISPSSRRARARSRSACGCCEHRVRARTPSRDREVYRFRRRPRSVSRHRVPFEVHWPSQHRAQPHRYYPAELRHVQRLGPLTIERPVDLEYRGQDGRYRRAHDIRLSRTSSGTEATYLDWSGPIAIERRIGA